MRFPGKIQCGSAVTWSSNPINTIINAIFDSIIGLDSRCSKFKFRPASAARLDSGQPMLPPLSRAHSRVIAADCLIQSKWPGSAAARLSILKRMEVRCVSCR
jgi:hypothetical protein